MAAFHAYCRNTLDNIRAQGRYREFTPLQKQAERFPWYRRPDGTEVLVWSSNDYLAMGGHPVVVQAACDAARAMGAGAGGTRNIGGTSPAHDALEAELASLHGKPAALLFTSGFVSNQAALSNRRHQGLQGHLPDLPPQRHDTSRVVAARRPGRRAQADRLRVGLFDGRRHLPDRRDLRPRRALRCDDLSR
jgi:hypothetical protein